jgi:exodeoxyribonuclease III
VRVITLNLNGIRSAISRGVTTWLVAQKADIILLQEVRATQMQIPDLEMLGLGEYHAHWFAAEKAGYSGVGILSKLEPRSVMRGFGSTEFDGEGRVISADFGDFTAISAYFPSGSSSHERQVAKYRFLEAFAPHLKMLKASGEVLIGGDFNIAHQRIDLKNWRSNLTSSGFLPEEREWMTAQLADGWSDVLREHVGADAAVYSWWSNRGRARQNDVGWRIDYQLATPMLAKSVAQASVYREVFYSDHAPVTVDYDLE